MRVLRVRDIGFVEKADTMTTDGLFKDAKLAPGGL
jgi:hypothetical protein